MAKSVYYKNPITRFILRKGFWRKVRGRLAYYRRLVTKDAVADLAFLLRERDVRVIFDCGANVGFMTFQFQKHFPDAHIYCFEPNPAVFNQLEESYRGEERIHVFQQGIGDQSGELWFNLNANSGTSSFLLPLEYHRQHQAKNMKEPIKVPVVRIDDFAREHQLEHIDILKLDIEGYEIKALEGAQTMLNEQRIDAIHTEVNIVRSYDGQPLFHEIISFLEKHQYYLYNVDSFVGQETPIRQGVISNATFISQKLRGSLEETFGKENCGW